MCFGMVQIPKEKKVYKTNPNIKNEGENGSEIICFQNGQHFLLQDKKKQLKPGRKEQT